MRRKSPKMGAEITKTSLMRASPSAAIRTVRSPRVTRPVSTIGGCGRNTQMIRAMKAAAVPA
jgi:hypothetical protein